MAMSHDPLVLPADLPAPVDDGAAAHVRGAALPDLDLPSTTGDRVNLMHRSHQARLVVFAYPRTGRPGIEPPPGWDEVLGARGCTPEACAFRDLTDEFTDAGAQIFGLSTQDPDDQKEAAVRLGLPYALLSDANLQLADALRLPTFAISGMTLLRRLTMILHAGKVEHVLYPVFPPDEAAATALTVLREPPPG